MLSIVIPTKNEEDELPALLASIQKQSLQPTEIIVADAFSTDATRAIAKSFGCNVVDGGLPGVGRNRGADTASGEVIVFLDADVQLTDPDFLLRGVREFNDRKLDFATCDSSPLSSKRTDKLFMNVYNIYTRAFAQLRPHAPGYCIFARRDKHHAMHGFDESVIFCEDTDYVNRGSHVGTFGVLRTVTIPVSVRRFDRDGRFQSAIKYIMAEAYMIFVGPIRSNIFHYTFGHKKK